MSSEGGAGAKRNSLGPKVIGAAVGSFQILEEYNTIIYYLSINRIVGSWMVGGAQLIFLIFAPVEKLCCGSWKRNRCARIYVLCCCGRKMSSCRLRHGIVTYDNITPDNTRKKIRGGVRRRRSILYSSTNLQNTVTLE